MKKIKIFLCAAAIIFAVSGAYAIDSNIDVRAGISYPYIVNQVGFDAGLNFDLGLDKYFALSFETGFDWVNMKQYTGVGSFTDNATVVIDDAYSVPLIVNAKIRFDMRDTISIMPYILVGAGYSWTFHSTSIRTDTYGGFTWQALAGIAIKLGSDSNINLIIDAGYRGAVVYLYTTGVTTYALNMSSVLAHIGVSFPLAGSGD